MRPSFTFSACALLAVAPILFIAWAIATTGLVVQPIDIRLALGPWVCLALSLVGLTLGSVRLAARPGPGEGAALGVVVGFGVLEVMAFGYITLAVAFGFPAAP